MADIVARVYRGNREESVHSGSLAVINREGKLTHYYGDPEFFTFVRSSSKPFQLIPLVETGAADHFGFTQKQLSVMCGSHIGSDHHRETVMANLEAAGNNAENLKCGCHVPIFMTMKGLFPQAGEDKDPLRHNCSGKHSGFLALAKFLKEDVEEYLNPKGKVQKMVLNRVAEIYGYPEEKMEIAVDGCSAPNFGLPLIHTAKAFLRLALAQGRDKKHSEALARIRDAMMEFPEMVSGEGRFDLALMNSFPGNVVCKIGAESIQGMAFRKEGIGIAVKIHDGNQRALYPVCVEVLKQLGLVKDPLKAEHLTDFYKSEVKNFRGILTGSIRPEFALEKA